MSGDSGGYVTPKTRTVVVVIARMSPRNSRICTCPVNMLLRKRATNPNLTPEDLDWLRKMQAATDAKRDPQPIPMEIAGKLRTFGFVTTNGLGGLAITDRGRGALLEQDMRDAEDR